MEIELTTIYSGVDEAWLVWYLNQLRKSGRPELIECAEVLPKVGGFKFSNADPTDPAVRAVTTYTLRRATGENE